MVIIEDIFLKEKKGMKKMKTGTRNIIIITLSVLLVVIYMAAGTYSVIIDVVGNDGINEIVNEIDIKDLLTDDNGNYNEYYYDIKRELSITDNEAQLLMNSVAINERLQEVLNNIVDVRINGGVRYTDNQIYNIIVDAINRTPNITDELKNKVINKSNQYKRDIAKYMYDIEVNVINNG